MKGSELKRMTLDHMIAVLFKWGFGIQAIAEALDKSSGEVEDALQRYLNRLKA